MHPANPSGKLGAPTSTKGILLKPELFSAASLAAYALAYWYFFRLKANKELKSATDSEIDRRATRNLYLQWVVTAFVLFILFLSTLLWEGVAADNLRGSCFVLMVISGSTTSMNELSLTAQGAHQTVLRNLNQIMFMLAFLALYAAWLSFTPIN
jgi:hypothetical protein